MIRHNSYISNLNHIFVSDPSYTDAIPYRYNKYLFNGKCNYKIEINNDDAHLIIKYKKKKYDVFIVKDDDNYYWLLKPYNQSYYKTSVDFDNSNIDIVFFAIRENEDLYS